MDEVEMGCERGGVGKDWVSRARCGNWAIRGVEEGGGGWDTPVVAIGMGVVEIGVADGPAVEVEIEAVEEGVADGPVVEVEVEEVEVGVGVRRGGRGGRLEPNVEVGIVVVTTWMEGVDVCAMSSIRLERPEMEVAKEDWRAQMVSCMDCIMVSREMLVGVASGAGCSAVKSQSRLSTDAVSMTLMLMVEEPSAIVEGEVGARK
ncbi:hypothetical protein CBR_g21800 [Chara braunii]|uniref:Uncharacterized protein n=1 Tax=Chara braunii TaxID=69332 RepID=A0A388JUJ8_CHABU|nr:hypothetical protein CBR_g21800 [Chara braunii]|eukprot:GBG61455.1 hypothetical protein CBR_g21800 [Chara braunii]